MSNSLDPNQAQCFVEPDLSPRLSRDNTRRQKVYVNTLYYILNSLSASGDLFHLLITCANCLDPDRDVQNVGLDLDSNHLTP